nr:Ig-like domain-containing protein [Bifidobacterium longum]
MTPAPPESIEATPSSMTLRVGETKELNVSVLPPDADQTVGVTVDDATIARVSSI